MAIDPYISVIIPVHNEQEVLEELYTRLTQSLDQLGKPYEIILTNDGSTDRSAAMLAKMHERRPEQIRASANVRKPPPRACPRLFQRHATEDIPRSCPL